MSTRPAETSSLRRVLMQSIMWLILAATIGLAALVDAHKTRRSVPALGEPKQIDNITLRFPADWEIVEGSERTDATASLELREPTDENAQRTVNARISSTNFFDAFGMLQKQPVIAAVPIAFGDTHAMLNVYRQTVRDSESGIVYFELHCETSRPLNDGKRLILQLSHLGVSGGASGQREQNDDIELLKKIAATLTVQSK